MSKHIVIDPVTRIEGHSRITIFLNDAGDVSDAQFHVTQFRGFEQFCVGRPFHEMPALMARICGICPVSHLIASAKACDALLGVVIPPAARALRRILNLAQIAQSHALSFFYLSSPDLLLGMDSDPAQRHLFGVAQAAPELARDGVLLRKTGQQIIELLGGKRIHPGWVVPGGVNEALSAEKRTKMLAMIPDAIAATQRALEWYRRIADNYAEEIASFANFPTLYMGLVDDKGHLETYDGMLRIKDAAYNTLHDAFPPAKYAQIIGEAVEPHSYLKSPFYKPLGYPAGIYRVGPLARMIVADKPGTPLADVAALYFSVMDRQSSFHFHYARLVEILYAFESIEILLNKPYILDKQVRSQAQPNNRDGVGVSEAPRGTLMHHYQIDDNGLITAANLIIATGHNNLAMNRGVKQVAQKFVKSGQLTEGMLNRVEAVIRSFDPCLSCSTHAVGTMPLHVQVVAPDGAVLDEAKR